MRNHFRCDEQNFLGVQHLVFLLAFRRLVVLLLRLVLPGADPFAVAGQVSPGVLASHKRRVEAEAAGAAFEGLVSVVDLEMRRQARLGRQHNVAVRAVESLVRIVFGLDILDDLKNC